MTAAPLERQEQRSVVAWLRRVLPRGSIVAAVVNEQRADKRDPYQAARFGNARRKSGVVSGFPDLVILLPKGQTFLIEMKRQKTGALSDDQIALHDRIRAIGHRIAVADSIDIAQFVLRQAGVPLAEVDPYANTDTSGLQARAKMLATKVRHSKNHVIDDAMPF